MFRCLSVAIGRVPDQLVNLDMKHGVEAKNYEEVFALFPVHYQLKYDEII